MRCGNSVVLELSLTLTFLMRQKHTYLDIGYGVQENVVQHVGKITNCVKHNKVEADTLNAETTMK